MDYMDVVLGYATEDEYEDWENRCCGNCKHYESEGRTGDVDEGWCYRGDCSERTAADCRRRAPRTMRALHGRPASSYAVIPATSGAMARHLSPPSASSHSAAAAICFLAVGLLQPIPSHVSLHVRP